MLNMNISETINTFECSTTLPEIGVENMNYNIISNTKKHNDLFTSTASDVSNGHFLSHPNKNGEAQRGVSDATLDNGYVVEQLSRPVVTLTLMENQLCSSLTVTNSHPLMSPDSDTENSCLLPSNANPRFNNFPDVVPNTERHSTTITHKNEKLTESNTKQQPSNDSKTVIQRIERVSKAVTAKNTINTNKALKKLSILRAHSPDILSSGSEADTSLYHATVEANFQSVALIANGCSNDIIVASNAPAIKRNGEVAAVKTVTTNTAIGSDDISSLDSISNHSFDDDEDLEHNLASLSPSSSLIDGLDNDGDDEDNDDDDDCEGPETDDDFAEGTTPTNMRSIDVLPQYSAAEERRDSRNWQKITLPDGRTREIDMKVIEPYKRVLSHGGYLSAGGHNAIVLFCACHLPDRSRTDYSYVMDNLFLYVVRTLDQLVTEDYVLIYLHGGTSRRNMPPFPWMKKCYQLLDRRLRKSLKNMYLVHPTFWIKSLVWMTRPFVSVKFWRKLVYVKSLNELEAYVAVEKAAIPDKVKQYDAKHN